MDSLIHASSAALGAAPARFDTTWPSLKMNRAGMPRTPSCDAICCCESTSTLTTLIWPSMSVDSSSRTGPIILHGPHHSAQKSTTTGTSDLMTSASKVASVTATVAIVVSYDE